jgi:predicted secreted protein
MAIRGMDIKVYLVENEQKTMLGGQRSCSLSLSAEELDVTCKTSNATGFGDFLAGMKNGEIQCGGLLVVDDSAQGKLFDAFLNSTDLQVEIKGDAPAGGTDEDIPLIYTATVVCTSLEINADYDGVVEYSATFKIRGDFAKVK